MLIKHACTKIFSIFEHVNSVTKTAHALKSHFNACDNLNNRMSLVEISGKRVESRVMILHIQQTLTLTNFK